MIENSACSSATLVFSPGPKLQFFVFVVVVGDERLFICCRGRPLTFVLHHPLVINQSVAHCTSSPQQEPSDCIVLIITAFP